MIDIIICLIGDEIAKYINIWKNLDYFVKHLTLE